MKDKNSSKRPLAEREHMAIATDPMLKKIGLRINKELYDQEKTVEWLAFEADIARSTLREIIAGRSNLRLLTLRSIIEGLGFKSVEEFLRRL